MIQGELVALQDEESIGALIGRLADDAKTYARAEVTYYRTLASEKAGEAKGGLIHAVLALVFASLALIALPIGVILALATLIGPGWATLIVVGVLLVLAGIFGAIAYGRLRLLFTPPAKELQR